MNGKTINIYLDKIADRIVFVGQKVTRTDLAILHKELRDVVTQSFEDAYVLIGKDKIEAMLGAIDLVIDESAKYDLPGKLYVEIDSLKAVQELVAEDVNL